MKYKVLNQLLDKKVGDIITAPEELAKQWIADGFIEEVGEKKVAAAPKDKAVKGSEDK